ncbi:hypothetical protein ScPMuIL_011429 [Solemya velum]
MIQCISRISVDTTSESKSEISGVPEDIEPCLWILNYSLVPLSGQITKEVPGKRKAMEKKRERRQRTPTSVVEILHIQVWEQITFSVYCLKKQFINDYPEAGIVQFPFEWGECYVENACVPLWSDLLRIALRHLRLEDDKGDDSDDGRSSWSLDMPLTMWCVETFPVLRMIH